MISEAWLSYSASVLPHDVPKVQRVETRRAFYAGAHTLLTSMMCRLDPGIEPTEDDLRRMDSIEEELKQFQRDMLAGRA